MTPIAKYSDENLDTVLQMQEPILLLFSNGNDLRNEFSIAFKKASEEKPDLHFIQVNPTESPKFSEHFNIGSKAVLIAYYKGEELARRTRPWGTDVPLAIEMLENALPQEAAPTSDQNQTDMIEETQNKETSTVDTKPVNVTDATFQAEVIDYELPVVVDFWAEWCGPCRMVAPILEKLAEEFAGKVRVAKVDVDSNPQLAQAFQVMSIPTIMMLKQRNMVFSQPGALPEPALRDLFQQLVDLEIPTQEETEEEAAEEPAQ